MASPTKNRGRIPSRFQELLSHIRVFIIIAIIVGIPSGLAVFYLNNNFNQEAAVQENLLLLGEGQKIEKQEAIEEEAEEVSGESEVVVETPGEKTEEGVISKAEQNVQETPAEEASPEGVYAPDFNLKDTEGNEVSLSGLRGNNILLVFWATWCGYCKKELPDLKNFVEAYKDKIKVLTIVGKEPKEAVQKYIEQEKINFPVLIDESGQVWNDYLVRGTPSHFLIDKEGRVVTLRPGYATKEDLDIMASLVIKE